MKLVEIQHVTKTFSNHIALNDVSFSISEGTVFGLLGPNGAGKTTLIRILNQITVPDSGNVLFKGHPLTEKDVEQIGYLPEERGLYKKMKVGEQALYLAQLKGLSKRDALERLVFWFRKFEIENWWNKKVEELSKGMQQKIQFIATIVHEPPFLILDEPFSGFDPINANLLKDEILALKKKGTTIILSTHNMASVEEICDDIVLINKAKKILEGNLMTIKHQFKDHRFEIEIEGDYSDSDMEFSSRFTIISSQQKGTHTILTIQGEEVHPNALLRYFIEKATITSFKEILPSMNEIFIRQVNNSNDNL